MSLKYAFFPGCIIPTKYPHFESATRAVASALGIELVDLSFGCCPPVSNMKLVHYDSWLALAARNLSLAEEAGLNILTTCTGCVSTLKEANYIMKEKSNRRRKVNRILSRVGRQYTGAIQVKHLLDVLHDDVGVESIDEKRLFDLNLRVACHYGCHLFRPSYVMYPESLSPSHSYVPTAMDNLVEAAGGTAVNMMRRFLCCGYPLAASVDEESSYEILREKLQYIRKARADLILVACASCFEQFELGQVMIKKTHKEEYQLPTLYLSQLIGLILGIDPKVLGLREHIFKVKKLLDRMTERRSKAQVSV